eukprot:5433173-Alexandrium_andersonii.AAC.1
MRLRSQPRQRAQRFFLGPGTRKSWGLPRFSTWPWGRHAKRGAPRAGPNRLGSPSFGSRF